MSNFNLELLKLQADLADKTAQFYKLLIKDLEKRKAPDNFDFEMLVKSLKVNSPLTGADIRLLASYWRRYAGRGESVGVSVPTNIVTITAANPTI